MKVLESSRKLINENIKWRYELNNNVSCAAWSPDGLFIALGLQDNTVRIIEPKDGREIHVLERHTSPVLHVNFLDNGRLLVSLSKNGGLAIWRTDNWTESIHVEKICIAREFSSLEFDSKFKVMVSPGPTGRSICIWDLDFTQLQSVESASPTIHYINSKAVLLGESSVGKSGLGIRMAGENFRPTESTHGAQFWHLPVKQVPGLPSNLRAELTVWDLAGQPEYRLIHQLFLDDADAAMLLFDCSDPNDPFRGVSYWAKVLKKQAPPHAIKFLVSARCDVSPITVDRSQINDRLVQYGLHEYFKTSAKTGEGVEQLFQRLLESIPWKELARTTTPRLFQIVRDFLLEQKTNGNILIPIEQIQGKIAKQFSEQVSKSEIDTVVSLLQSRGLVQRLDPRPGMSFALTRPELINQYASSIIQAARNHPLGIGSVPERNVLIGDISFSGFERLPRSQEAIVLEGTTELLIRHGLCFREMGLFVFPSQINITRPAPLEIRPRTEVAYRFSGSIEMIYASLVVRLTYTDYFRREDQWKYAAEFSRDGEHLGFSMHQIEEGTGELEIYFYPGISEFDRVTFIRFVTDHLRTKGIDIQEEIRLYCPNCGKEVKNREAIEARIKDRFLDIPCQYCATSILIPKGINERYRHDNELLDKQKELIETVGRRTKKEIIQLKANQQQYSSEGDDKIHILHLSDLHLFNKEQAQVYKTQLETDLIKELKVRRLEYLIITGDIGNYATEAEYEAAFDILDSLVKQFGLNADRVIIAPGNHDLNYDDSEYAYQFIRKGKVPASLPDGRYFSAGDAGIFALKDGPEFYQKRFSNFSKFCKRVYGGREYPLEHEEQAILIKRPEDKTLFLCLNSCWQIDHHFESRAGIDMVGLTKALVQPGLNKPNFRL